MKFLNGCGRICVALDILVLIPIFGTSTTHIPTQVSYVRMEAGKGRFAVWQVCDYIVTPRTIFHALAM